MDHRGEAEAFWGRCGNGVRRIRGLPFADLIILPTGHGLALIPAELDPDEANAEFEKLLWRCYLIRYGHAAMRERMQAWVHGDPAA